MTSISRIVKIGDTDISSYVEWGPRRAKGAGRKVKTSAIIGSNRAVVWEEGREPLALKAELQFLPTLADQIGDDDEISALIDDLSGNQETDRLYFGRTDRFAVVYGSVGDSEIGPSAGGGGIVRKTAEFWAEAAELYAATPTAWDDDGELPLTMAEAIENAGNLEAGLYSLALTARASGPALEFDGSNDYVTAGAVDLSGNALSIEFLFYIKSMPAPASGECIINYEFTSGLNGTMMIMLNGWENGDLTALIGVTGATFLYHGFFTPTVGLWYHCILTVDVTGNAVILYKNGVKEGATWTPTSAMGAFAASKIFTLNDAAQASDIILAKLRVWQRVLSASEALAAYNGETVSDTSLVIEYDFCEGQGATVYDLSGNSNDGTLTNFADTSAGYGDDHDGGWLSSIGPVSPALELLGAADAVMDSLTLTSGLMTGEVLEQDRFGQITQTYSDDFTADVGRPAFGNGYFWADGYAYAKYVGDEIVLTSLINGRVGETITITITDTDQASTTVSVTGYDITVDLETSGGTPVATAQEVIDAINADDEAKLLVLASLADGEDGDSVIAALAETALSLDVTVTGGALVIEALREVEYRLEGQWPLKKGGLLVTFTPTEAGTGEAFLEASIDQGDSWLEVSSNSRWVDGAENKIYVPQAEGYVEAWIRWRCDGDITSLSIDDLRIVQLRAVSGSDVPKIPVGEERVLQVSGTGRAIISAEYRDRYKP